MKLRSTICRLLALLAVVGLLFAPVAGAAMGMPASGPMSMGEHTATADEEALEASEEMPCCPSKASIPDCGKDCPFMALCTATPLLGVPLASGTVPPALASIVFPSSNSALVSVVLAPPRKPPKV